MLIELDNRHPRRRVDQAGLRRRLARVLRAQGCPEASELSVVLVDDPAMAELNRRHMDRRGPTNVLAFPMDAAAGLGDEPAGGVPYLLGDVVVSLDTAAREAAEHHLEPGEHLVRLLIHGVLHLLGHDHLPSAEAARRMEELTERLLLLSRADEEE